MQQPARRSLRHGFLLLLMVSALWVTVFLLPPLHHPHPQQQQQQQPPAVHHRATGDGTPPVLNRPQSAHAERAQVMLHGVPSVGNITDADIESGWREPPPSGPRAHQGTGSPSSRKNRHASTFTAVPDTTDSRENWRRQENTTTSDLPNRVLSMASAVRVLPAEPYLVHNASFFALRQEVVNPFRVRWRVQQASCPSPGPFLLVVIPSVASHTAQRTAIRQTWASPAYPYPPGGPTPSSPQNSTAVKVVFFLGLTPALNQSAVTSEAGEFRDLVLVDFLDSYRNLSLKMALVLHWVHAHCSGARHVIKVDEDTFVNLPLLLDVLTSLPAKFGSRFVLGRSRAAPPPPLVSRGGKWAVSRQAYPLPHWPQYLYGHSYVISGPAIPSLRHAARHMPLMANEDAYVTGVLAKSGRVVRLHSRHFALLQTGGEDRCRLVKGRAISQTGLSATSLYSVWRAMHTRHCSDIYRPRLLILDPPVH